MSSTARALAALPQLPRGPVAFQGVPGAWSDLACRTALPGYRTLPCASFEDAFAAVHEGRAALALLPVENSHAGRVADVHTLLPDSGLHIAGEFWQPVDHALMALPGVRIEQIKAVLSHPQALAQTRERLRHLGLTPIAWGDTAGAAEEIARRADPTLGALASPHAAELYGLSVLLPAAQDSTTNTTRFLALTPSPVAPPAGVPLLTSLVFRVRQIPAALFKALGGFATQGINLTRIESWLEGGRFQSARFWLEAEGDAAAPDFQLALEELGFFARDLTVLGTYAQAPERQSGAEPAT